MFKILCKCLICGAQWGWLVDESKVAEAESLARATAAPCGHQGCFELEKEYIILQEG